MAVSLGKKGRVNAEPNVTPMVDVMMVLLVIFMVTTPMLQQGIAVHLPTASGGVKHDTHLTVTIKADGSTFIDTDYVEKSKVLDTLKDRLANVTENQVHIKVDRSLMYQQLLDFTKMLQDNHIEILSVVVDVPGASQ